MNLVLITKNEIINKKLFIGKMINKMEKIDASSVTKGRLGLSVQNWALELKFSRPNSTIDALSASDLLLEQQEKEQREREQQEKSGFNRIKK